MSKNVAIIETVELANGSLAKYDGNASTPGNARVRRWVVSPAGRIALGDEELVPYADIKGWPPHI
jgi:hypothetical protein